MKKILLSVITCFVLFSCMKEVDKTQVCDFVYDKYYQNPPGDTTLANRTYWLRMTNDTLATGPGSHYVLQVPKTAWDTMLVNSNYEIYCY